MERTCKYCGKSLRHKRQDAKFCSTQHRLIWHRRQNGIKPQRRQVNRIRTDTLEFYIALARHQKCCAETVLRQVSDKIGAPIREDAIEKELRKLKNSAKKSPTPIC